MLVFRDRAADTLSALSELYELGDWGRRRVIATLSQIASLPEVLEVSLH